MRAKILINPNAVDDAGFGAIAYVGENQFLEADPLWFKYNPTTRTLEVNTLDVTTFNGPYGSIALLLANLMFAGEGVPVDAVRATLTINPAGVNNSLLYTAKAYGAAGNAITVVYVDPDAISQALAIVVVGSAITVNLARRCRCDHFHCCADRRCDCSKHTSKCACGCCQCWRR